MNSIIQAKISYALFAVIILSALGFTGIASAQDTSSFIIQTFDHLCTGAFLKSSAVPHTTIPDEELFYSGFYPYTTSKCESCEVIVIDFPYYEFHDSIRPALLERTEVFGIEDSQTPAEISPYDRFWAINEHAQKPMGGQPGCFPGLDYILNNIVKNVIGSPDSDSIPAPYDYVNSDDLMGVIINIHEPSRVQEYLEQNGAVSLSTTVSPDEHAQMEAFVPVSLLIPFVEQHPDVEVSAMVVGNRAIIHTGDWYYSLGERSVWRSDVEPPRSKTVYGGNVGVVDMSTDHTPMMKELSTDMQNRCHYIYGANLSAHMQCNENISAKVAEILTNTDTRAKLYVVDTNLPDTSSTVEWMFDKGVDTIHILTDAEMLTATISRAYLLSPTAPPSLYNSEPILDIGDAILSQEYTLRHWFSVQDYNRDDHLIYAAVSSNNSVATVKYTFRTITSPESSHDGITHSADLDIISHSEGRTKITISVSDGSSVVTDTFNVIVTNNTSPELEIDGWRFDLVVGEAHNVTSVAIDPDGDMLSYKIVESAGGFEFVSVSTSNDTITLTPIAEGQGQIEITASDGKGGYDQGSFRVCVVESNSPPQLSPMPSHIAVPIGAETVTIQVIATDTDGDKVIFPTVVGYNRTVANIEFLDLGSDVIPQIYYHSSPCNPRYGVEQHSIPLFITPNAVGNTTVTIGALDTRSSDFATFQVIVYEPAASNNRD